MDIKPYLDSFPLPAKRGILSDVNKEDTDKTIKEVMKAPDKVALRLVERLIDPGSEGNDIQARHLLHAMAVRIPEFDRREGAGLRSKFCLALAKTLSDKRPDRVKAFIIRQLQLCGGEEVISQVGKFLTVPGIADDAAQALIAIGKKSSGQFRNAVPRVRNDLSLYSNVLHGLAQLADEASKDIFIEALKNNKDECRLLGLWGLTQLADVSTLPLFIETDLKGKGYSRIKSASYCLQFAEKIQKKDALKIYQHLINTRTLPEEKYLREIAESNLK